MEEEETRGPKRDIQQKRGVHLCPRAVTFSRPLRSADEHAATRQRAAKLMEWMLIKSGPNPQTEPTSTSLEG